MRTHRNVILAFFLGTCFLFSTAVSLPAQGFPAAGWHRGDVSIAQENSYKAIDSALHSESPHLEVDIFDFIDENGKRIGILAHDYKMDRIAGTKGRFNDYHDLSKIPSNTANPDLSPEPYMSVIDLFGLIKASKKKGITPFVSLDMKEEGDSGEAFGKWVGNLIKELGFEDHVFASSFYKSNIVGVEAACPECMTGGLVFNDHYALKHLDNRYTSLDLTGFSKATFFLGFPGKKEYPHDFVLIQDDILFEKPDIVDYWRNIRKVKFVGVFVHNKQRPYTEHEWDKLQRVEWLELDSPQMRQKLEMTKTK